MATPQPRILVVDDDADLRRLLQRYLGENGYCVRTAASGAGIEDALCRETIDAIVLDIMMPGEDGLTICRHLRGAGNTVPIIMLTARGDPIDRIVGIEMGADDYLAKPFNPRELLARLGAVLRRSEFRSAPGGSEAVYKFGPFALDIAAMTLKSGEQTLALSAREFSLLVALVRNAGKPLSRARIIDLAFGRDAEVTDRAVDVQVTRLRKALGDDPADPRWIKTVWGVGYVFSPDTPQ